VVAKKIPHLTSPNRLAPVSRRYCGLPPSAQGSAEGLSGGAFSAMAAPLFDAEISRSTEFHDGGRRVRHPADPAAGTPTNSAILQDLSMGQLL
jgi:hypothetical protein